MSSALQFDNESSTSAVTDFLRWMELNFFCSISNLFRKPQFDIPTAVMVRQIIGSISQFEKSTLVAKLKAARVRKRKETGRCEGRKPTSETHPELIAEARRLRRKIALLVNSFPIRGFQMSCLS